MFIDKLSIRRDISAHFGAWVYDVSSEMVEITSAELKEDISAAMGLNITGVWLCIWDDLPFFLLCTYADDPYLLFHFSTNCDFLIDDIEVSTAEKKYLTEYSFIL